MRRPQDEDKAYGYAQKQSIHHHLFCLLHFNRKSKKSLVYKGICSWDDCLFTYYLHGKSCSYPARVNDKQTDYKLLFEKIINF